MSKILDDLITDDYLAWDQSLEKQTMKYLIQLSTESIDELVKNRTSLSKHDPNVFPCFKNEILNWKNILQHGYGFFIISGTSFDYFTKDEIKSIFIISSKILGDLLIQNIKNEKIVKIEDEGQSLKKGGRYHQTREGGSYHTDSPHWKMVPDYVGLYCINPAIKGGTSKFVSAYTIHNTILKENKDILKLYYNKFYFDKRSEYSENESPTILEPIFEYNNGKLSIRYLRDYIDDGYKLQKLSLPESKIKALDYLEKISQNEECVLSYDLRTNDMVFFNNHRILHGRTSFVDHQDQNLKRLMIRIWIKDM